MHKRKRIRKKKKKKQKTMLCFMLMSKIKIRKNIITIIKPQLSVFHHWFISWNRAKGNKPWCQGVIIN